METEAVGRIAQLKTWFLSAALPRWATAGVDVVSGGFHEKLDDDGAPIEEPRRARLVARQVYVFATAARLGWNEGAAALVDHGLEFLRDMLRADDTVVASVRADRSPVRNEFDLYDTAFVLFGLAAAYRSRGEAALAGLAERIRARMIGGWAHPRGGFEESAPSSLPLKSNPHMHLLESCLAWEDAGGCDIGAWQSLADQLVELCVTRFIDPETGALREYFDHDWAPFGGETGRIVEPGHQFEWSWLLLRWAERRNRRDIVPAALRLLEIGEQCGVDSSRNVAINELDDRFAVRDASARLWPQTERIKAWHRVTRSPDDPAAGKKASENLGRAIKGLERYIEGAPWGLWRETMRPDGTFFPEPARASSLYHIACAVEALDDKIA